MPTKSRFSHPAICLLSRSVYDSPANIITPGVTQLPPGCVAPNCVTAIADGTYPTVFNNDTVDGSFGITAPILLDELLPFPSGDVVQTVQVPNSGEHGVKTNSDQMVTSFSSKSEIGLNLSLDRNSVSFMGYLAPANTDRRLQLQHARRGRSDQSGASTDFRVVASVDQFGQFHFTKTNAYSGNNGRAAILNNANGANVYYTTGNAGNGANPQPNGVIVGAGAQIITPSKLALAQQPDPGQPTPVGSLQRHRTRRQGRQDRQGHQLPRPHGVQQRDLRDQGFGQQRRQHGVFHRHLRLRQRQARGLPDRLRRAEPGGDVADHADRLQRREPADARR